METMKRQREEVTSELDTAIGRAKEYLLAEADKDFPDTLHVMCFPRLAGFTAQDERQSSDIFVRGVLAVLLLDIAELLSDDADFCQTVHDIAHREAYYVAQAKRRDCGGGWSYFPGLPELPPDLDSLAAALHLFSRCAPQYIELCLEPIHLALLQAGKGLPETWILSPSDPPRLRSAMQRGINCYWRGGVDIDACAHFFLALTVFNARRFAEPITAGVRHISAAQHGDGHWEAKWYWGPYYVGALCMELLRRTAPDAPAIERATNFLLRTQREDGGWGVNESAPLDTAHALWSLGRRDIERYRSVIARGLSLLLNHQAPDGSWNPAPWIKMQIGRTASGSTRTATYYSTTLTSAFCLRALCFTFNSVFHIFNLR